MILILAGGVFWLRNLLRKHDSSSDMSVGFSIEELEALRDQGQLGQDEFKRLRRAVLGIPDQPGGKGADYSSTPENIDDAKSSAAPPAPLPDDEEEHE